MTVCDRCGKTEQVLRSEFTRGLEVQRAMDLCVKCSETISRLIYQQMKVTEVVPMLIEK